VKGNSISVLDSRTGPMAASWLASCLLHGGLAVAAILFVQRMQLAPQAEPFQWDVAMVATLSPLTGSTSPGASKVLPTPTLRQPAAPLHSAVRPVQPKTSALVTSSPPGPMAEFTPEPHQAQPLPTEPNSQGLTTSVPGDSPPQAALQHLSAPSSEPVAPPHDRSTNPLESQAATGSTLPLSSSANASTASTNQFASAKADYGWLTDLMARWIEDLNKRYPATLRTDGVQGKVTLTAMLHENGLLSDVRVVKSSGNTALDEVALEDVRNGPPINLSRPLERTHMPVKFSISYDLRTAR
jgi:protein TonB